MTKARTAAAPAPPAWNERANRAVQRTGRAGHWLAENCFILAIIAFNGATSFNHMVYLAGTKGGQHGADIEFAATMFDLFVFAMRFESQRDKRRGTIRRLSAPVFLQMIALLFSVLANYATATNGFWGITFAVAPPIMVMLAILMLERRYRLDALARTAPAPAGTGDGTGARTAPAGSGTAPGTAPRTGEQPAGTGTGPAPRAPAEDLGAITRDGRLIPQTFTIDPAADRAAALLVARAAIARYMVLNNTADCPAWALAAALHKNKTWVGDARAEIAAEDDAAAAETAGAVAAPAPDDPQKELSA